MRRLRWLFGWDILPAAEKWLVLLIFALFAVLMAIVLLNPR